MNTILGVLQCSHKTVGATSSFPSKKKCSLYSRMYLHLTKQEARKLMRIFLWKSLFMTLTIFLCLVKEVWLSLDLHTHSSHFNFSHPPPCQQSHFCRVKIKCGKKNRFGASLSFFFPSFMFIQRLNEFSVFLHTSFVLTSYFPIAPAGPHCLHWHQIGKECKRWCYVGNWGKEEQSGSPNIRQNYVKKLEFEIIRNS